MFARYYQCLVSYFINRGRVVGSTTPFTKKLQNVKDSLASHLEKNEVHSLVYAKKQPEKQNKKNPQLAIIPLSLSHFALSLQLKLLRLSHLTFVVISDGNFFGEKSGERPNVKIHIFPRP